MRPHDTPPTPGSEVEYRITTVIREDDFSLYGFTDRFAQDIFKMLISVSGIGPKQAVHMLSMAEPTEVASAIAEMDSGFLVSMKGVGKKTADKVILELKTPMGKLIKGEAYQPKTPSGRGDLIAALTQLGYRRHQIDEVVGKLPKRVQGSVEESLREALRMLGK